MSGSHLSKDFFELIKSIGECKSKQEEDKILQHEVTALRQRFTEQLSPKKMKEAIVRMMYAEMLGHNADFGHIHAVNMSQQTNLVAKRVGYLASTVCLHPEHELTTLLVNTMRRDLKSSNHVEVCATLIAIPKLVNLETLPALMPPVIALLEHPREDVRKKAVMALHRFCQLQPSSMTDLAEKLRRVLCDKDPAVMGASLYILHEGAEADPKAHKDLVPSYVSILKQITEHRLPSSFDYHRMPAPWIQIKLLKVLATLGTADQRASEGMYEVLSDVLRRADTGINIGYAIIYECVRTITAIFPNIQLLEKAAEHISRFVSSDNHNLKYLGIKALAAIVQVNQTYALDHQLVVVDCLEDPDETLKRKTLDLLFRMTNASNVVFVVEKLITHLRQTNDELFRASLTERITQLAERYAPDNSWFIRTMNAVFELGGELVRTDVAHNLMRLIAEGSGDDDDADAELRRFAAATYYEMLDKPKLPDILICVVCWVLGEYGYLIGKGVQLEDVADKLADAVDRQFTHEATRCWVIVALTKLVAQMGTMPELVGEVAAKYRNSCNVLLAKYCYELEALAAHPAVMRVALPVDASCEDLEVDPGLGFLDGFVAEALSKGAQPYLAPGERPDEVDVGPRASAVGGRSAGMGHGLRFDEYETVTAPSRSTMIEPAVLDGALGGGPGPSEAPMSSGLNVSGVKSLWGAEGYGAAAPAPPPAAQTQPYGMPGGGRGGYSGSGYGGAPALAAAPPIAAVPTTPRELTEKERMAAMLFGGIGGAPAAPPAAPPMAAQPVEKKKKKKEPELAAATPPAPPPVDLLGGLFDDTPPPTTAAAVPASSPPPASMADDLLSLIDGPAVSSTPVMPAPMSALGGALGGTLGSAIGGAMSRVAANPAMLIPATVDGAGPRATPITSDGRLALSLLPLRAPGSTELRLSLRAESSALRHLQVTLDCPPTLSLALTPPPGAQANGMRCAIAELHAGGSVHLAANLKCIAAAGAAEQHILGQVAYSEALSGASHVLSFKMPLHAAEMLRPHPLTTPQFGQIWPMHAAERKTVVTCALASNTAGYVALLEEKMGLAKVDVIGVECICCAKLVGSEYAVRQSCPRRARAPQLPSRLIHPGGGA